MLHSGVQDPGLWRASNVQRRIHDFKLGGINSKYIIHCPAVPSFLLPFLSCFLHHTHSVPPSFPDIPLPASVPFCFPLLLHTSQRPFSLQLRGLGSAVSGFRQTVSGAFWVEIYCPLIALLTLICTQVGSAASKCLDVTILCVCCRVTAVLGVTK